MKYSLLKNIRSAAEVQGMSIRELGRVSGVGENAIFRWDQMPPKIHTLQKVADVLQIDYRLLLPETKEGNQK